MRSPIYRARNFLRFLVIVGLLASSSAITGSRSATVWAGELALSRQEPSNEHPLAEPLRVIQARREQIRREVRDFSCVLTKRERINGVLQEMQTMRIKVCENFVEGNAEKSDRDYQVRFVSSGGESDKAMRPVAIFVEYEGPKRLDGRRILFVEGQNDNQMIIRKGGPRFSNLTLKLSCGSEAARRESLNPITEMSFDRMAACLIRRITEAMQADPTGENTHVETHRDLKVNDRSCSCICVTHPKKQEGLHWHVVQVFIDEETQLPIRLETYGWPESEDEDPPLMSEFTYSDLKVNVGLSESDFSETLLTADAKQ